MAEEDLECGRWLLWDSVASYEALVLCGASSGVIKLWNPLSRSNKLIFASQFGLYLEL